MSRADSALHQIFFYNKGAARATLPNNRRRGWSYIVSTLVIYSDLSSPNILGENKVNRVLSTGINSSLFKAYLGTPSSLISSNSVFTQQGSFACVAVGPPGTDHITTHGLAS